MTAQEIFDTTAVRSIEKQILSLYSEFDGKGLQENGTKQAIVSLLKVRKRILDSMFVLDEQHKRLLAEFNGTMKQQLIEMRKRSIDIYNAVYTQDMVGNVIVEGKCFLGYEYSRIHPIQTMRAKKMWAVLNGTLDDFLFLYCADGVNKFHISSNSSGIMSENEFLYLNDEEDNWNEGLDSAMTSDMHLTYAFHNLFSHLDFSIYDLLWVRDFNIELHVEQDYNTYKSDEYGTDLDWDKADYFD